MKWWDKLKLGLSHAWHDVFGEEARDSAASSELWRLLAQAEGQLHQWQDALAQATAREKRAEMAWQTAVAQASPLANSLQEQVTVYAQQTAVLRTEIAHLQTTLAGIRAEAEQWQERETQVTSVEQFQQWQRELSKVTIALNEALEAQKEAIARREDGTAVRSEIEQNKRVLK